MSSDAARAGVQVVQSPHIEFHLKWAEGVLLNHGSHIMAERATFSSSLRALHMGFSKQFGGMCTAPRLLFVCPVLLLLLIPFPGPPAPCATVTCHVSCTSIAANADHVSLFRLVNLLRDPHA